MSSTHFNLLTGSLVPRSFLSMTVPSSSSAIHQSLPSLTARTAKKQAVEEALNVAKAFEDRCTVKQYDFTCSDGMKEVGSVMRIARAGGSQWMDNVDAETLYAVADSNHRISTFKFPFRQSARDRRNGRAASQSELAGDEDEDEDDSDRELEDAARREAGLESDSDGQSRAQSEAEESDDDDDDDGAVNVLEQFEVKSGKKVDHWVGLEVHDGGILSAKSSGLLSYHPTQPASVVASARKQAQQTHLPSPLTCLRTMPSSSSSPSQFALAGKDVEVSVWDLEKTLSSTGESSASTGQKRKKNELAEGETWRARNLPNNHLNLRVPVHHLCLTTVQGQPSQVITGTKSGHVRRYDTREESRRPTGNWKVARDDGGVKVVEAGGHEHELFFADTTSLLGSLDLRTGKILYTYASQTCTSHSILPVPFLRGTSSDDKDLIGLASVSSDATLRLHTITAPPENPKSNVLKGKIIGGIPGVGISNIVYCGHVAMSERSRSLERPDGDADEDDEMDDEDDEDVWNELDVVQS